MPMPVREPVTEVAAMSRSHSLMSQQQQHPPSLQRKIKTPWPLVPIGPVKPTALKCLTCYVEK